MLRLPRDAESARGPLGTPLLCAWLLRANRARIQSPLGDTPAERHHSRSLDTKLNHLRWIFASYTCECWWFETCEIVRRVLLTGALVLIPVEHIEVRLMTAILLAFASVIVHETTRPYQDFGTNILALCSHIVIFGLFFLGSQINCGVISGEFLLALVICGPLLLPIAVMVYLQWSRRSAFGLSASMIWNRRFKRMKSKRSFGRCSRRRAAFDKNASPRRGWP